MNHLGYIVVLLKQIYGVEKPTSRVRVKNIEEDEDNSGRLVNTVQ